jgi:hypothetical protein
VDLVNNFSSWGYTPRSDTILESHIVWKFIEMIGGGGTGINVQMRAVPEELRHKHANQHSYEINLFALCKENKQLYVNAYWIFDATTIKLWKKSFFALESLQISNYLSRVEDMDMSSIQQVLGLLNRPQQEDQSCPFLLITRRRQFISFDTKDNRGEFDFFQKGSSRMAITHKNKLANRNQPIIYGNLKQIHFDGELLTSFGQAYTFVQYLVLESCTLMKEQNHINRYSMDLSSFNDIHELTFDLNYVFRTRGPKIQVYIQFIHGATHNTVDCYRYYQNLGVLQKQSDATIPDSAVVVKIQCNQIRHFTFKRRGKPILIVN